MDPDMQQVRSPGLPRRLAAIVYDSILLFGILLLAVTVVVVPYLELVGPNFPHDSWLYRLYLLLVAAGFYVFFWTRAGQTLGMQAWRLRLQRADGGALTPADALRRLLWATLTLAPAGLGLLWVLVDREGLSLYDRLSRTRLVVIQTPSRASV